MTGDSACALRDLVENNREVAATRRNAEKHAGVGSGNGAVLHGVGQRFQHRQGAGCRVLLVSVIAIGFEDLARVIRDLVELIPEEFAQCGDDRARELGGDLLLVDPGQAARSRSGS